MLYARFLDWALTQWYNWKARKGLSMPRAYEKEWFTVNVDGFYLRGYLLGVPLLTPRKSHAKPFENKEDARKHADKLRSRHVRTFIERM